MTRSIIYITLLFLFNINNAFAINVSEEIQLEKYVNNLLNETYQVFQSPSLTKYDKQKKAAKLIKSHLYFQWMANYSLGRYRKTLPKDKIIEFTQVYKNFVINSYADLSLSYQGEKAKLVKVRRLDDDLFMVHTKIMNSNNNSEVKVDYLVHEFNKNGQKTFLVGDIITEGISILHSQQSEFKTILKLKGIDLLIAKLQLKGQR